LQLRQYTNWENLMNQLN